MIRPTGPERPRPLSLWVIAGAALLAFALPASVLLVGQMVEAHAAAWRPVSISVPACPAAQVSGAERPR